MNLKKGQIKNLKSKIQDAIDNKNDMVTAHAYSKWYSRWAEICGGEIDFTNPYVKVEMVLCDVKVQAILTDQKTPVEERRIKARKYFPDDETYELYLYGSQPLDPENTPYTYIESKSMMKHAITLKKK